MKFDNDLMKFRFALIFSLFSLALVGGSKVSASSNSSASTKLCSEVMNSGRSTKLSHPAQIVKVSFNLTAGADGVPYFEGLGSLKPVDGQVATADHIHMRDLVRDVRSTSEALEFRRHFDIYESAVMVGGANSTQYLVQLKPNYISWDHRQVLLADSSSTKDVRLLGESSQGWSSPVRGLIPSAAGPSPEPMSKQIQLSNGDTHAFIDVPESPKNLVNTFPAFVVSEVIKNPAEKMLLPKAYGLGLDVLAKFQTPHLAIDFRGMTIGESMVGEPLFLISPRFVPRDVATSPIVTEGKVFGWRQIFVLNPRLEVVETISYEEIVNLTPIELLKMDEKFIYAFGWTSMNSSCLKVISRATGKTVIEINMPNNFTPAVYDFDRNRPRHPKHGFYGGMGSPGQKVVAFQIVDINLSPTKEVVLSGIIPSGVVRQYSFNIDELLQKALGRPL